MFISEGQKRHDSVVSIALILQIIAFSGLFVWMAQMFLESSFSRILPFLGIGGVGLLGLMIIIYLQCRRLLLRDKRDTHDYHLVRRYRSQSFWLQVIALLCVGSMMYISHAITTMSVIVFAGLMGSISLQDWRK